MGSISPYGSLRFRWEALGEHTSKFYHHETLLTLVCSNGEFEQSTDSEENLFVDEYRILNLRATLQDQEKMQTNYVIDLLRDRTCTGTVPSDCVAATNVSEGNVSVVPPTRSARITTRNSVSILYGRVCVTAKMPLGD